MLDKDILTQLSAIFSSLKGDYELKASFDASTSRGKEMKEFLEEFASVSEKITFVQTNSDDNQEFALYKDGSPLGIAFRGVPGGHEFNTLLLAILNADGQGRNLPDEGVARRIRSIVGKHKIEVFVSLTCTNCPDVAQACDVIALTNPNFSGTITDGGQFPKRVEALGIQAVPTVFVDDELLTVGRASLSELIGALETRFGVNTEEEGTTTEIRDFDVLILGGGPAGASAGIYAARKGQRVAIVAEEAGGSVNQTGSIENLITTRETTGAQLAATLRDNAKHYGVQFFEGRAVKDVNILSSTKSITAVGGEIFQAPSLIIATGSRPRKINVPGESEYVGKGVAFCPHCDGPMFKGKKVAVIGGGNSGIEAAIDLAGICQEIMVFEFLDVLKADEVLVKRAESLPNVKIYPSSAVTEIIGDGKRVTGLKVTNRKTNESQAVPLQGVFVQIGIIPNSQLFSEKLEINKAGEIVTDRHCRTSVAGVYAAGDVADGPYKQIVTAIGEGAIASLTAFDDSIRK